MDYYRLHEMGYNFGDMRELTPLQVRYLALCKHKEQQKSQKMNEEMEQIMAQLGMGKKKSAIPNVKRNTGNEDKSRQALKQKIKQRGQ